MAIAAHKPAMPLSASVVSLLTLAILVSLPVSGDSAIGPQSRDQAPRSVETVTSEQARAQEDRPDADTDHQAHSPASKRDRAQADAIRPAQPAFSAAAGLAFGQFALPPPSVR